MNSPFEAAAPPSTATAPTAPFMLPDSVANDEFVFVQMPDGSVRAVLKSDVQVPSTSTQDSPAPTMVEKVEEHFYVHLANGDVIRVKESDLPVGSGTNAPLGHWQRGKSVFLVTGVYPVESTVEG